MWGSIREGRRGGVGNEKSTESAKLVSLVGWGWGREWGEGISEPLNSLFRSNRGKKSEAQEKLKRQQRHRQFFAGLDARI